jgi:CPA2 family monovalent cation:H+ antiporter-2
MHILSIGGIELSIILGVCGLILILGLILKQLNQPYIIAYILTGVILGPSGLKLVTEYETAEAFGEFGLVVLMFYIGMEISLKDFIKKWRIAFFGTGFQILFSILLVFFIGLWFDWTMKRVFLLGFIISLSSSAVVFRMIQENGLKKTIIGQNVISILLTQDIVVVPMIIIMSILGGDVIDMQEIGLQIVGGVIIMAFLIFLLKKKTITLPFQAKIEDDHELQVFGSLIVCFGMAFMSSLFGLSAGLGAFVAGLFVNAIPSNQWLHDSLNSFRVILISIFFLSVGMLIDLNFLLENWIVIILMILGIYISNQGVNALALRLLKNSWKESLYGGALLAQIGEFSFVLASVGYHSDILTQFSYQLSIIIISISILISPLWLSFIKRVSHIDFKTLPQHE